MTVRRRLDARGGAGPPRLPCSSLGQGQLAGLTPQAGQCQCETEAWAEPLASACFAVAGVSAPVRMEQTRPSLYGA
jgi:hypothetical protein